MPIYNVNNLCCQEAWNWGGIFKRTDVYIFEKTMKIDLSPIPQAYTLKLIMTISWSTCTANSWYWKKGVVPTELVESTWRIKIRCISLELYHVNTNIFVIFFFKIEMLDLHAVSIFATATGESDITTTRLFLQVVEQNL